MDIGMPESVLIGSPLNLEELDQVFKGTHRRFSLHQYNLKPSCLATPLFARSMQLPMNRVSSPIDFPYPPKNTRIPSALFQEKKALKRIKPT